MKEKIEELKKMYGSDKCKIAAELQAFENENEAKEQHKAIGRFEGIYRELTLAYYKCLGSNRAATLEIPGDSGAVIEPPHHDSSPRPIPCQFLPYICPNNLYNRSIEWSIDKIYHFSPDFSPSELQITHPNQNTPISIYVTRMNQELKKNVFIEDRCMKYYIQKYGGKVTNAVLFRAKNGFDDF